MAAIGSQIHGLDLRHAPSVEIFARYLEQTDDRLDILINNAAQTVRRPPGFYAHLLEHELAPGRAADRARAAAAREHATCAALLGADGLSSGARPAAMGSAWRSDDRRSGIHASAALSQIPYALDERRRRHELFPEGRLDADLQQVDLRSDEQLAPDARPTCRRAEMLEVQLVNAVAPFILCSKLKPLMLRATGREQAHRQRVGDGGQFSRHTKTDKHPHTNMAKAALNMMTLTSAPRLREGRHLHERGRHRLGHRRRPDRCTPSASSRSSTSSRRSTSSTARRASATRSSRAICTGEHVWGKFFKDYKPTRW